MTLPEIPFDDPQNLFINAFDLEDNPYNRAAGYYCVRDMIAGRIRPAFKRELITPQVNYIICGPEGDGKSTFCRILAGDQPGDTRVTERYTDAVDISDLLAKDQRADAKLYRKICGCSIVEWADKSMAFGDQLAGIVKSLTNKGSLKYLPLYSNDLETYYCRHVNFFTTNDVDFMTKAMGSRRWIIIDTYKSLRRSAADRAKSLVGMSPDLVAKLMAENKNPGLNWVAMHLPGMFRRMYATDDWKGDLNLSAEMIRLMQAEQLPHMQQNSWAEMFKNDFQRLIRDGIGIGAHAVDFYAQSRFQKPPTNRETANLLRELGYDRHQKKLGGTPIWVWHPKDVALTAVRDFAKWEAGMHRDGRFIITDTPRSSDIKRYAEAAIEAGEASR